MLSIHYSNHGEVENATQNYLQVEGDNPFWRMSATGCVRVCYLGSELAEKRLSRGIWSHLEMGLGAPGAIWAILGASWGSLGSVLGRLGGFLGLSWDDLGRS